MRQVPELADVPVIFLSGCGRDETVAKAFESGAADCLLKPFSATELAVRIRAALIGTMALCHSPTHIPSVGPACRNTPRLLYRSPPAERVGGPLVSRL